MPKPSPKSKKPLDKHRILQAGIEFADEHGVEALSMRKIADTIGCGVMSLYNHVKNKDEMIIGMVDCVVGKIESPVVNGDWKDAMRRTAAAANKTLLLHHWAAAEWSRRLPGPERIRYMDSILRILTEADLSPALIYRGYHAITMHIVGFTLQQIGYQQTLHADFEATAQEFIDEVEANYPFLAEHVRAHLDGDDDCDEFGFVLDLILDGLERAAPISTK